MPRDCYPLNCRSNTNGKSDFAKITEKAMRRAQRNAERENARFGLPLIVQKQR